MGTGAKSDWKPPRRACPGCGMRRQIVHGDRCYQCTPGSTGKRMSKIVRVMLQLSRIHNVTVHVHGSAKSRRKKLPSISSQKPTRGCTRARGKGANRG